ncbi:hypothetical protein SY2F82_65630 [Streptomyces sp. Y2F8-2]|uniref:hypothetical protein n=1 Tax=Streptomyces sp. Y2F8-2 TaxID=2759675 RepID=UPI001A49307C|nr:hypothetical protein [Streptomyces sp. Y2F8-2]GHK04766.1 hypothetical protein SY2F82_65630 [Streptomyces sp. Y2F8-2]
MADDGTSYYEPGAGRELARKFELQAYDLRAYLKEFQEKTGEEAITDGFGVLTESAEVTSAYIAYSSDVASAMKVVHEHLDKIADALRKVNRNTEVTDNDLAVLFGKHSESDR